MSATQITTLQANGVRSNPPHNQSVQEASLYLGISERKLRDIIARGEIKAVRLGRRVIIRLKDMDAFLAEHLEGGVV